MESIDTNKCIKSIKQFGIDTSKSPFLMLEIDEAFGQDYPDIWAKSRFIFKHENNRITVHLQNKLLNTETANELCQFKIGTVVDCTVCNGNLRILALYVQPQPEGDSACSETEFNELEILFDISEGCYKRYPARRRKPTYEFEFMNSTRSKAPLCDRVIPEPPDHESENLHYPPPTAGIGRGTN